ncbi:MAG: glycosyltransferase [Nitrospinota bacterium]
MGSKLIFHTALRPYVERRLEEIGSADLVVGIPCYNNETTIGHVVSTASEGLRRFDKNLRSVILVSDGGSTDDTRDMAQEAPLAPWQELIVSIYRGPSGKGTAFRQIFEAVERLGARACLVFDSDLRSITPDWVRYLAEPILEKGYHFVAPNYARAKYDGTITNNIVYNLTRALYGKRIRQPIGGDFSFSQDLASYYCDQNVWTSHVARFGVDIWMTTMAITQGFRVCQANLGLKVHDAKDPASDLDNMFRQVVMTLFSLMEPNEPIWRKVCGSEPVESFGVDNLWEKEPEAVEASLDKLIDAYQTGFHLFRSVWRDFINPESFKVLQHLARVRTPHNFYFPDVGEWVRILFDFAAIFHHLPDHRFKLVNLMSPLYYARVGSFVVKTEKMSSRDAECVVEEQAKAFETNKEYLIERWDNGSRWSQRVASGMTQL